MSGLPVRIFCSFTLMVLRAVNLKRQLRQTGVLFFHFGAITMIGSPHLQHMRPRVERAKIHLLLGPLKGANWQFSYSDISVKYNKYVKLVNQWNVL